MRDTTMSIAGSVRSDPSYIIRRDRPRVMPGQVYSRPRRPAKQQTPQAAIDEFWARFTTKTPGKGAFTCPSLPVLP